jgi:hypothetical protein
MSKTTCCVGMIAASLLALAGSGANAAPHRLEASSHFIRVDMQPVPDPAKMSPADRARIYGRHYGEHRVWTAPKPLSHRYLERPRYSASNGWTAPINRPALGHTPAIVARKPAWPVKHKALSTPTAAPTPPPVAAAPLPAAPAFSPPHIQLPRVPPVNIHLPQFHTHFDASDGGPALHTAILRLPLSSLPDWLAIPGHPALDVPGVGSVPSKLVSAAGILLAALILLLATVSNSGGARRRRRRRTRNYYPGPMMNAEPGGSARDTAASDQPI